MLRFYGVSMHFLLKTSGIWLQTNLKQRAFRAQGVVGGVPFPALRLQIGCQELFRKAKGIVKLSGGLSKRRSCPVSIKRELTKGVNQDLERICLLYYNIDLL